MKIKGSHLIQKVLLYPELLGQCHQNRSRSRLQLTVLAGNEAAAGVDKIVQFWLGPESQILSWQ